MSITTLEENASRREDPAYSGQITTTAGGPGPGPAKATPASRLPGIDMIRVCLTWGILLFHTSVAYSSTSGWYISAYSDSSNKVLRQLPGYLASFMDVWQMPMFFFLSGVSVFHALKRRSEKEFRKERLHRLLVPWLVLVLTNGVYSITILGPNSPGNKTFSEFLMTKYALPNPGQGWFLLTLYIFSQVNRLCINCMHVFYSQNSFQQMSHLLLRYIDACSKILLTGIC